MRGIPSLVTDIRKKVFTEVARLAYQGNGYKGVEDLPFKIVPGDRPLHRESVFLERAIAGERVRLAMGLGLRPVQERALMTKGMDAAAIAEQYYEPPLINIIPYACHACPTNQYKVSKFCQNCLAASCQRVCPKGAISFVNGRSYIDQEKCIKCGKCAQACPYNAIVHLERPCQKACGMDAIGSDEYGRAQINQDKCVSCGQCLVSCPFGAIADKGQIFQIIQ
ncbi:MAG: 4Fe-4S binding protein [Butyricicoccus sp.]|nr:4Fe-4S binding protein [Butyricicoccus sp.]